MCIFQCIYTLNYFIYYLFITYLLFITSIKFIYVEIYQIYRITSYVFLCTIGDASAARLSKNFKEIRDKYLGRSAIRIARNKYNKLYKCEIHVVDYGRPVAHRESRESFSALTESCLIERDYRDRRVRTIMQNFGIRSGARA